MWFQSETTKHEWLLKTLLILAIIPLGWTACVLVVDAARGPRFVSGTVCLMGVFISIAGMAISLVAVVVAALSREYKRILWATVLLLLNWFCAYWNFGLFASGFF